MEPTARKPTILGTWIALPYVNFSGFLPALKNVFSLVLIVVVGWAVLGALIAALGILAWLAFGISTSSIDPDWSLPFLVAGILILGVALYWFRCLRPGWYGGLEIAGGFLLASHVVHEGFGNSTAGIDTRYFTVLGALYIVVRGMDNIYKSLKTPAKIQRWNRFFFLRPSESKL